MQLDLVCLWYGNVGGMAKKGRPIRGGVRLKGQFRTRGRGSNSHDLGGASFLDAPKANGGVQKLTRVHLLTSPIERNPISDNCKLHLLNHFE